MQSSRSTRRAAVVTIQSTLGGAALLGWALLNMLLFEAETIQAIASGLPYFVAYELGVLSRYLPGLRTAAKRFE